MKTATIPPASTVVHRRTRLPSGLWALALAITMLDCAAHEAEIFRVASKQATSEASVAAHGTATAFVVAPGLLLTNKHVVSGNRRFKIWDAHSDVRAPVTVLAVDDVNDLALIRANVDGAPLPIGEDVDISIAMRTATLGYPLPKKFGYELKLSQGWVRSLNAPGFPARYLLELSAERGSSGSPVITYEGQVIGVVTGVITSPLLLDGVPTTSDPVPVTASRKAVLAFLKANNVPYVTHRFSGPLAGIAQALAPSVYVIETYSN